MYKFSKKSLDKLTHVHPLMVDCVERTMSYQVMDFSVIEGARSKERQKLLYEKGVTKTLNSKHLIQSDGYGHAVDLYPYPIDMLKVNRGNVVEVIRFGVLAGLMKKAAIELKVDIVWGADWDGDGQTLDHTFFDAPHFQLVLR